MLRNKISWINAAAGFTLFKRCVWAAIILLMALVATGVQVDREARTNQTIAAVVPSAFAAYALETLARQAYASGDTISGLAYAQTLVRRRPVPAESLALLSYGLIATGKDEAALPVVMLAATRGWRDFYTQRLMISSATPAGEHEVAAQRLLALWRQRDTNPQTLYLTQNALADRATLGQFGRGTGAADASWSTDFLVWATDYLPASSVLSTAALMVRNRVTIDCQPVSAAIGRYARAGQGTAATALWSGLCANGPITGASDFAFKSSSQAAGPFDWQFPDQAGLAVDLVEGTKQTVLHYDNQERTRAVLASRNSALQPGSYSARVEFEDKAIGASSVIMQVTCYSANATLMPAARLLLDRRENMFQIPSRGCVGQRIAIIAGRGEGKIAQVIVSRR